MIQVASEHCDQPQTYDLPASVAWYRSLRCQMCQALVTTVDVRPSNSWIETQVARKRELTRQGRLGTRKQSVHQSDEAIDLDGLAAELAACAILCPRAITQWCRAAERQTNNRGRDLPRRWTGLDWPVEVKQTRYQDQQRGFLLVRPPRHTPGRMRPEYIDLAYYVLLVGQPYRYTLVGWTDRQGLLRDGQLNPVPVRAGQRECWGLHWSQLRPVEELVGRIEHRRGLAAMVHWLSDLW